MALTLKLPARNRLLKQGFRRIGFPHADVAERLVNRQERQVHVGEEVHIERVEIVVNLECGIAVARLLEEERLLILCGHNRRHVPQTCTEALGQNFGAAERIQRLGILACSAQIHAFAVPCGDISLGKRGFAALAGNEIVPLKDADCLVIAVRAVVRGRPLDGDIVAHGDERRHHGADLLGGGVRLGAGMVEDIGKLKDQLLHIRAERVRLFEQADRALDIAAAVGADGKSALRRVVAALLKERLRLRIAVVAVVVIPEQAVCAVLRKNLCLQRTEREGAMRVANQRGVAYHVRNSGRDVVGVLRQRAEQIHRLGAVARVDEIDREVKAGLRHVGIELCEELLLGQLAHDDHEPARQVVERVALELTLEGADGVRLVAELVVGGGGEHHGGEVLHAVFQRVLGARLGSGEIAALAVEHGGARHGGRDGVCHPRRLAEGVIREFVLAEPGKGETAQVVQSAALGMEVVDRECREGAVEHFLRLGIFVPADVNLAENLQCGGKIRLQPDGALKILLGRGIRVAILHKVQTRDIQFVRGLDFVWHRHLGEQRRQRLLDMDGLLIEQHIADGDGVGRCVKRGGLKDADFACGEVGGRLENRLAAVCQHDFDIFEILRRLHAEHAALDMDGCIIVCIGRHAERADGVPGLLEALGLISLEPGKVRLVVGVRACHQLGIGARGVGQRALPGAGQLVVRPGEHLLADRDVVVADVDDAALLARVVAAEVVIIRGGAEIGGRELGVEMLADVHAVLLIEGVAVEVTARDGVGRIRAAVMEVDVVNVGREENFIVLVDRHGGVLPPEERVAQGRAVGHLHARLEDGAVVGEVNADHALHAIDRLVLGEPDGDAAVLLDNLIVARQHGGCAVVVGPVELDAARDPGAEHADQRGLDDFILIEEVVAGLLVERRIDLAADLGQDHKLNVIVFEDYSLIGLVKFGLFRRADDNRVWIRVAGEALMHAVLRKHRQLFCGCLCIGRDHNLSDCRRRLAHIVSPLMPPQRSFSSYGFIVARRSAGVNTKKD